MAKTTRVGILTAGGDSPGLNAAIRGVGKAALGHYGMEFIGFRDGFRGLAENRTMRLDKATLSGILTVGGTILGTSRDKPHRMEINGQTRDMTQEIVDNCKKQRSGRPGMPWRRRDAAQCPAAGEGRAPGRNAAQDNRQRCRPDRRDIRLRHGNGNRHRCH